jgi:hypothetical protein
MPSDRAPKVGWEFVTWTSTRVVNCVVPSCRRVVSAGHVRVDHPRPAGGDPVLCVDCYGLIMAGLDPDPEAQTPQWEQENRAQRLKEVLGHG